MGTEQELVPIVKIADVRAGAVPSFALWRLGFRPFYLLASIFAAFSIALWTAQYEGWLTSSYLPGPVWHAHEMLYGFTLAVITGFMFTAVRNWTERSTPTGGWLMAIAGLWVAGRFLIFTPYAWLSAFANAAFPLAVAIGIAIPLFKSRNRRNYVFVAILAVIALSELYVHLSELLTWRLPAWVGIQVALDLVLVVMSFWTNTRVRIPPPAREALDLPLAPGEQGCHQILSVRQAGDG